MALIKLFVLAWAVIIYAAFPTAALAGNSQDRVEFTDETALDKKTRIMWTKDVNIAKKEMNWQEANDYIKRLNKKKYAGYSDWQLPRSEEFATLLNFVSNEGGNGTREDYAKFLNMIGFKNVRSIFNYWSTSTISYGKGVASIVDIWGGIVYDANKGDYSHVWPIRVDRR